MMILQYEGVSYREDLTYRDVDGDRWIIGRGTSDAEVTWDYDTARSAFVAYPDTLPEVLDYCGPLTEVADA